MKKLGGLGVCLMVVYDGDAAGDHDGDQKLMMARDLQAVRAWVGDGGGMI